MKVLITGTARGIGRACALKYLAEGHEVFGFDIRESTILADRYTHLIADITKELPDISGVQVLVNNAGIQLDGDEADGGLRGKEIDVNLKGTIAVTEKYGVTPDIRAIVFMASSSASNGASLCGQQRRYRCIYEKRRTADRETRCCLQQHFRRRCADRTESAYH